MRNFAASRDLFHADLAAATKPVMIFSRLGR